MHRKNPAWALVPLLLSLAGCSTAGLLPTAPASSDSSLRFSSDSTYTSLRSRGTAPYTRTTNSSPGETLQGPQSSTSTGRSGIYLTRSMTLTTSTGTLTLNCRTLDPKSIRGIHQRYSNDCAQAAIAMTLDYLGVSFAGAAPYDAVAQGMPPMSWGTRIEDVTAYLGKIDGLSVTAVRQASLSYLDGLLAQGKAVPVILSLGSTMHYLVVIGRGTSRDGQGYVLCKDPAQTDTGAVAVMEEATFTNAWENQTLRNPLWSWFASLVSNTNPSNYERVAFDVGLKAND
ncbi:MAG TPA: hypothetical protein V6D05_16665 [Stenomitos sp.]